MSTEDAVVPARHPSSQSGRISVALCTFNGERFLPAQLLSFVQQDRLPDELVIGDDGSTDSTESLIADFAKRAPFPVRFHRNPVQLGVGPNFDQTIGRCSGEFIALCDQDDEWRRDKLVRLESVLKAHPEAGYVCSDAELIDSDSKPLGHRLWEQYRCNPGEFLQGDHEQTAHHLLLKTDRILGATMLIRSAFKEQLTPIPPTWVHDHWLSLMFELLGAHGVAVPDLLTRHRLHGQQTCGLRKNAGRFWQKRKSSEVRQEQRERRRLRLIDLRAHLVDRLIPNQPSLVKWLPLFDEADRVAERAVSRDRLGWWRKGMLRLQDWWMKG